MRIAYWITKATNTLSEYVILISFPGNDGYEKTRLSVTFIRSLPVFFIVIWETVGVEMGDNVVYNDRRNDHSTS